jgi:Protein of unknown function (DUF1778)
MRPVTKGELSQEMCVSGLSSGCRVEEQQLECAGRFFAQALRSIGWRRRFGRCTLCGGLLEMTDRDRDRFLAALDRPPKPLPELERAALPRACATGGER